MFEKLSVTEADALGISFSSKVNRMTGEQRARVTTAGISVSITQVPAGGGWQNSHRHRQVVEDLLVVKGQVIGVEKSATGALFFSLHREGSRIKTRPGLSHNLFVPEGTTLVTTKFHDDPDDRDWEADSELDALVKSLTWEQALQKVQGG